MEKDTAPYLRWGGYIPRPPTRLISNWRAKTSRIRLHKERRRTVQDSFMIGDLKPCKLSKKSKLPRPS